MCFVVRLSRYRELFRCARTIESELLDVLYKWIPEHVEAMAPLQNIQLVEEAAHDILDGKYALSQEIGRGRFGQVFACTMADGRRLAVKRMSKHKHMNTRKMARLCDCLSILHEPERGRRHPNILYLERVMQSPTHFYMVMARMPGDLYEFIGHECTVEGGLDEPIALDVIRPVLSALHHLHRLGYAHRDIKSENILVDSRRAVGSVVEVVDVKLIDFDMSCQLAAPPPPFGSSTQGSLGFMAPEVLFREIPDHGKLDVWSAACVLLEMSMGRKWFNAVWVQAYSAYAKREKEVRGILGGRERAYEDLRQSLSHNAAVSRAKRSRSQLRTPVTSTPNPSRILSAVPDRLQICSLPPGRNGRNIEPHWHRTRIAGACSGHQPHHTCEHECSPWFSIPK
mmetsp:Transcript_15449/g.27348  ORF Transcript_15449/g.27348 Transcript_15449/m.27348 type:complete len:397 (+) Transcript_15449:130-1320(+)